MSKKIGVIAEDKSDVDVIGEILGKYMCESDFKIKPFVGKGCGKIKSKCVAWTENLYKSGCDFVLVFHDLDSNCEVALRKLLEDKICPKKNKNSLIVIPIEEMEAWLLSDCTALRTVFKLKKRLKKINACESISSPKEHLAKIVYEKGKKRYINTLHNKLIARDTTLSNLRRCKSYRPLDKFIKEKICA